MKREHLERLAAAAQQIPELRFGQLIHNAIPTKDKPTIDIFYISDEDFVTKIEQYVADIIARVC